MEGTVDEFLQFWFEAENHIDNRVLDVVKRLRAKGMKCYVATNQEKYRTQFMKAHMGFEEHFDHVFSSADIGYKKPQKEFFTFILQELLNEHKIYPHEVLFFDDTRGNVQGAKELDIDAHFYDGFERFLEKVEEYL